VISSYILIIPDKLLPQVNNDMGWRRSVATEIPRCGKVVVGGVVETSILGLLIRLTFWSPGNEKSLSFSPGRTCMTSHERCQRRGYPAKNMLKKSLPYCPSDTKLLM